MLAMTDQTSSSPKNLRTLDSVDAAIVRELTADGRMTNAALAERLGIAASTCLTRVRSLQDRGVLRGFHADVDLAATGLGLRAVVSVKLQADARGTLPAFAEAMATTPGVQHVYFVGGADDFLIDLAVEDTGALREFVVQVSQRPEVGATHTSIVFDFLRGRAA
jgi:DNA-binding Lrp family transcriptional regulator